MKHTNSLQSYNERLFKVNSNDYLILSAAVVAFVIIAGVVSSTSNAQNSSSINSNGFPTNGTAKNATNQTNKTVIVAAPGTSTSSADADPLITLHRQYVRLDLSHKPFTFH
jgi:hypothetical protein